MPHATMTSFGCGDMKLPENVSESVRRLNPHLYERKDSAGLAGLRSAQPECNQRGTLESIASGEGQGSGGAQKCYRVIYTVYSRRPNDFDNVAIKQLQDCLVLAKLIPDDNWKILSGTVVSKKANSAKEEATIVEIEAL